MQRIEKILAFAQHHKQVLHRYFYDEYAISDVPNALQKFRKHEINALFFLSLENPNEFCRFLNTPFLLLENIINNPVYLPYTIKKKRGGYRQIYSPEKKLKAIQKRLNYFLQAYYLCIKPENVFGFVVNPHYLGTYCNIAENAKLHVGKKYLLNIDLKNFFPSISANRVKSLFSSSYFDFSEQISTALTLLTIYEGKLPVGAPSSPAISNFVCMDLDADLNRFSEISNLKYSRYADDLTFSSEMPIKKDVLLKIKSIIEQHGFEINEKKLRFKSSSRKQTVTGLIVNEKVNVDRKLLKKVRAIVHDLATNGIDVATKKHFKESRDISPRLRNLFINKLDGYINFIGQVRGKDDPVYINLKTSFEKIIHSSESISLHT